ncbi:DUF3021 domain-containing protein [Berryella wangjianweii]|uniref:DUF3021 domain-containing protein n=1 Tax=Berryella wangjianweii TaxID=2734634 RepID=A0A6M8IZJ8_9ACTN|nr:DUF3021 domain-containing protein [Berryella wangjianweii]QKF06717.1 DUF3021 domain-containing protein [Berryella wangjianweii]
MSTRKYMRRALIGAAAGIAIGCMLELAFSAAWGAQHIPGKPSFLADFDNQNLAVLTERVLYALLGAVQAMAGLLFPNERRSLAATTAIHFLLTCVPLLGVGMVLKWWQGGWPLVGALGIITVIYALIWMASWLSVRATVRQVSERIEG